MTASWRGSAAIVGVAESQLGLVDPGMTPLDLVGQATAAALREAGLVPSDIDSLYTASAYYPMAGPVTAEYLGIRPRMIDGTNLGGSSFVAHALHAARSIAAGDVEVALITYASTQRSDGGKLVSASKQLSYEEPYRPMLPISMYALAAERHMHEFGTTRRQLAEVAVAARAWAKLNPMAFNRDDLTIDDVLGSRMVSSPLTVRDCCLVTDGGGAVLMTSAERAKDLAATPVYLLGGGEATWHSSISMMPDLTVTAAQESGHQAYASAGVNAGDIDVVELYDAFTINPILFLEDLGFCEKGEGGDFVDHGRIAPGGELAVNTNGGGATATMRFAVPLVDGAEPKATPKPRLCVAPTGEGRRPGPHHPLEIAITGADPEAMRPVQSM